DRKLREEMQLEFRRIQRELGVTTINVTHDQREALIMSDEIIVMDKGRIQQKARPAVAYRKPANPFVAGFIGVTNFLAGTAGDGGASLVVAGRTLPGAAGAGLPAPPPGTPAIGALRAEQIRIAAATAALEGLATVVAGTVTDAIFEGDRVVYEVAVDGLDAATLRVFDHDPALHAEFAAGSPVFLGWNARDLTIFAQ
ncbi:MAG TPA: ABC transporter ATP-binding protein, partial [Bauldia sp.]|nr:ABC transporter ATP-binding protein [Bauldia sp.]